MFPLNRWKKLPHCLKPVRKKQEIGLQDNQKPLCKVFERPFCCKTSLSRVFRHGACVKVMCLWPFPHINSETSQSLAADWWGETVLVWKHFQLILRRSHFYNWFKGLWMCARSVWNRQCSFFICNCFWRRLLVRDGLGLYQGLSCVFIAGTQLFYVFCCFEGRTWHYVEN